MLRSLYVSNYAIIDELEISFSENLTIITGETGAGKSILLGALSLILGKRADTSVLYSESKKCVVEGNFDIRAYDLQTFFDEEDLDFESATIVRREINAKGKSRAFINDTPVTLSVLRKLSNKLIDVHAQHETLELTDDIFQMNMIDAIAGVQELKRSYQEKYRIFTNVQKQLTALKEQNATANKDHDYISFQLNELAEAELDENDEQNHLEDELDTLTNAEEIKSSLIESVQMLSNGEMTVIEQLSQLEQTLRNAARYHKDIEKLQERVSSSKIELQDINNELEEVESATFHDEQRIQEIQDRLNIIYKLEKKHQVQSIEDLIHIRDKLEIQMDSMTGMDDQIKQLEKEFSAIREELLSIGSELASKRSLAIPRFEKQVNSLLEQIGMANAKLKVNQVLLEKGDFTKNGVDKIQFLFSANLGVNYLDVSKVASGGELSRLMLIIKSLVAGSMSLPTLVFDEIDSGISGEVGLKVGKILEQLSKKHQVVCITHLPQIASKGSEHYFVFKETLNDRTVTQVKSLGQEERVEEIAKMLSGEKPTTAAIENARELLMN